MPCLAHIAILVRDYDEAIAWYREVLGFELLQDIEQPEQRKRWVLMRPVGAGAGAAAILLARAASSEQACFIGNQAGGRVFLFLHTDDFERDLARLRRASVRIVREPSTEIYGKVAVFEDLYGNLWDLIQPYDGR